MGEFARTVRLIIRGRVQGVGFRAYVAGEARRRGLGGWVRNRRDGAVEAMIAGPPDAVEKMIAACRRGPSSSRVAGVDERAATASERDDAPRAFAIRPTA